MSFKIIVWFPLISLSLVSKEFSIIIVASYLRAALNLLDKGQQFDYEPQIFNDSLLENNSLAIMKAGHKID